MSFVRRHSLPLVIGLLGLLAMVFFTWGEWHAYAQEQQAHHEVARFWSIDHLADWADNAGQNWQSELLFGIVIAVLADRHLREES